MSSAINAHCSDTLKPPPSIAPVNAIEEPRNEDFVPQNRYRRMNSDQAFDSVVLFNPFIFADPTDGCQQKLNYGLSFVLKPRENIDPFQYVYSLAHESAVMCMFYCSAVNKTVKYKLVKRENIGDTHTVDCVPTTVMDGPPSAKKAGEFFKRNKDGVWRDAFSEAKLEGPIAESVRITDKNYNSLHPWQSSRKIASPKP